MGEVGHAIVLLTDCPESWKTELDHDQVNRAAVDMVVAHVIDLEDRSRTTRSRWTLLFRVRRLEQTLQTRQVGLLRPENRAQFAVLGREQFRPGSPECVPRFP